MNAINVLLALSLVYVYHLLLLTYTLTNDYIPNLTKVTRASPVYKLIKKSFNIGQNYILLGLAQFNILILICFFLSEIANSIEYPYIYPSSILICNFLAFFHARLQKPIYHKINLGFFTPLFVLSYTLSLPFLLTLRYFLSFENLKNTQKSTINDFFSNSLSELKHHVSDSDKSLIESICLFDSIEARQIMIPKVDMFCLDQKTSIYEAAKNCINMGFSRIPVYSKKIDNIHAVLLFKDLLKATLNLTVEEQKKTSIKEYVSPIIFSPETKKIKDLFQEIKKQRIHASIIINEYGCTEGLVTMEDILEELLGSEILDESDVDEEILFMPIKDATWIVNPKMSIIDARKHLNIDLRDSQEYETITGYIFSKMGTIPKPGTHIQEDSFHISILKSDKRKIDKIKISKTTS